MLGTNRLIFLSESEPKLECPFKNYPIEKCPVKNALLIFCTEHLRHTNSIDPSVHMKLTILFAGLNPFISSMPLLCCIYVNLRSAIDAMLRETLCWQAKRD